jgi:MFS family permease
MAKTEGLTEYYKLLVFVFLFGYAGTVWGGLTYYIGIPLGYMNWLKASSTQIGLVSALFWGGFAFPQIFAAYMSESKLIKKWFIAASLGLSCVGFLVAGVYIFATGASNAPLSTWIFLICFAWAALVAGFYIPPYFAMIFKLIPSSKLGQLLGIMFAIEYLGIFLTGFTMDAVNKCFPEPYNYAVVFTATFVMTLVSLLLLLWLKEPEGNAVVSAPSFGIYARDFFAIFWKDRPFTTFIFGKWLMSGHIVMLAFLLTYLIKVKGFPKESVGWFTALNGLGLFIGGFTITKIADVFGPKYLLITAQVICIIYTALAWLVPSTSLVVIFAAFIISGMCQIADNVGYTNSTLFYCPSEDKTTYCAAVNLGIILPMIFLPVIMGKLMDWNILTFNGTFTVAMCMMVAAILYIALVVENPKAFVAMKNAQKGS